MYTTRECKGDYTGGGIKFRIARSLRLDKKAKQSKHSGDNYMQTRESRPFDVEEQVEDLGGVVV